MLYQNQPKQSMNPRGLIVLIVTKQSYKCFI